LRRCIHVTTPSPARFLLHVAADALEWCGASRADPLALERVPDPNAPVGNHERAKENLPQE
jgi:hypothetical protein